MKKEKYRIGLDLGITSVGFAVLATNDDGTECKRIIEAGARMFDIAEDEKGKSLAADRRKHRGDRRRIRRRAHRLQRIKALIVRYNLLTKQELELCYKKTAEDIYSIRSNALDKMLNREEFARLLIHLAQRRGFKSNRKTDSQSADEDDKKLLASISENEERMKKNNWRTVGEMFMKDTAFSETKRNSPAHYLCTVTRELMLDEIKKIFSAQRLFKNEYASEEFEVAYTNIYQAQRNFDDGPGGDSPYGGNMIEKMVGYCTLFPEERRAASACYTTEYFSLLGKINSIRVTSLKDTRFLTAQERDIVRDLFLKNKSGVSFKQIRAAIQLPIDEYRFIGIQYRDNKPEDIEGKSKLPFMKSYHIIRSDYEKIMNCSYHISDEKKDEIGRLLTYYKNDARLAEEIDNSGLFAEKEKEAILTMKSFQKFGHLSLRAMKMLIPHLEQGLKYNEACEAAGLDFQARKDNLGLQKLPSLSKDQHDINNPVVLRTIQQTIKVINAITKKYGAPVSVHIEVARDMGKSKADRDAITKTQEKNRKESEKVRERLQKEFSIVNPRGGDILRLRLHQEQNGRCLYTGKPIMIERLFEAGYCDVDHIIPYSLCFDDSYNNKVLVLTGSNREKDNNLPKQFIKNVHEYSILVENTIKNYDKKRRLLKECLTEEDANEMKSRNLNDTRYLSRYMMNYIQDHLGFDLSVTKKKRVVAVNGRITARLRGLWGITKVREEGDLHHARDAVVIACIGDGLIKRVTDYENRKYISTKSTEHYPDPWPDFRQEMICRFSADPQALLKQKPLEQYQGVDIKTIRPIFVSRRVTRKTTGSAHKETIMGAKRDLLVPTTTELKKIEYNIETSSIEGYCHRTNPIGLYDKLIRLLNDARVQVLAESPALSGKKLVKKITSTAFSKPVVVENHLGLAVVIKSISILKVTKDWALKRERIDALSYDPESHSINNYYNPSSDILLYNLLCEKLKICYENAMKLCFMDYFVSANDKKALGVIDCKLEDLEFDKNTNSLETWTPDEMGIDLYDKILNALCIYSSSSNLQDKLGSLGVGIKNFTKKFKDILGKYRLEYFKNHAVFKPSPKGGVSSRVQKVKIYKKVTTGIDVNEGVAENGDMVRIDIYHRENDGYYFVPIYVADLVEPDLPMKAVVQGKPASEWKLMQKEDFCFSLYRNSLIRISRKQPIDMVENFGKKAKILLSNSEMLYYRGADIATGSISFINHDNSLHRNSFGIKSVLKIELFNVDALGQFFSNSDF